MKQIIALAMILWGSASFAVTVDEKSSQWLNLLTHLTLDRLCKNTGYSHFVFTNQLTLAKTRLERGESYDAIRQGIENYIVSPYRCGGAGIAHVTKNKTQLPMFFGATFNGPNLMLSTRRNLSYYSMDGMHGHPAISAFMGMHTERVGIALPANGRDQEHVSDALKLISQMSQAGYRYAWPVIYLKGDCCEENIMPAQFGNPADENQVYSKVQIYTYGVMKELLAKSLLPILMVEVGNEVDGGFWTDFDSELGKYNGPPKHLDKTKKILKAAKEGIRQAYREEGLSDPFYVLHVMPDTNFPFEQNLSLIQGFLSPNDVNESLFDIVTFSYYPNSRDKLDPHQTAKRLRDLGDTVGLPWGIAEMGIAQEGAPDPKGWNNFIDFNQWCPVLFKTTCEDSQDYQSRLLESSHYIFGTSRLYRGSIYLAPQDNILNTHDGVHSWTNDLYRLSLYEYEDNVIESSNSPAIPAQAFWSFQNISDVFSGALIEDVGSSCDSREQCLMWLWGRNFGPSSRIEVRDKGSGRVVALFFSNNYKFETPSVISFYLPSAAFDGFKSSGLSVRIVNYGAEGQDIPSAPFDKYP